MYKRQALGSVRGDEALGGRLGLIALDEDRRGGGDLGDCLLYTSRTRSRGTFASSFRSTRASGCKRPNSSDSRRASGRARR